MLFRLLLVAALALGTCTSVEAQSTGRHRRTPPPEPTAEEVKAASITRNWAFTLGAGLTASGDLFRVRTTGDSGIPWLPPAGSPFLSDDFRVTLDEDIGLSVGLARRLQERLWLRLDLSSAQMDMTAIARAGQTADIHQWDQLTAVMTIMSLEYRLVHLASFPYLLGGAGVTVVGGEGTSDYDQTRFAWRLGAGYHKDLSQGWGVRGEIRGTFQSLDFADYRPPVDSDTIYPDVTMEDYGITHFWEFMIMIRGEF
jgi:opacity protein-like surface antigen